MLNPIFSSKFKKDYKSCQKRGYTMRKLTSVMTALEGEEPLEPQYKAHPLRGDYSGYTECHIEPDWLLVYKIDTQTGELYFIRTGTHSDLFE